MRKPFNHFGIHIDIARQIERPEVLLNAVKGMGKCGYDHCMVYLEDAFVFTQHPGIARNNAYTAEFMQELQKVCANEGMELIPGIPSLAHCDYITTKKGYEYYDEGRSISQNLETVSPSFPGELYQDLFCRTNLGTISPSYPETYTLLRELYEDWCNHIPGSYIQIGLDEAVAMGNYHCRIYGKETFDRVKMFAEHANKLNAICKSMGRRMMIAGDMFYYLPQAIDLVDKDIIILDWFYYRFDKTTRIEAFNFSDIDLSGDLKKKGFEVWGFAAVWPVFPIADVQDRWGVLCDWIRYGQEKNIEGLTIADFENCIGFYGNADILFRAFGLNAMEAKPEPIEKQIFKVLKDKLQVSDDNPHLDAFVSDMMQLGRYHVAGRQDRLLYMRPLEILSNKNRQAECKQKYEELKKLFVDVPRLLQDAKTEEGRGIINGLYQSYKFLLVLWKFGAILPDCYEQLCRNEPASDKEAKLAMLELAGDAQKLFDEYNAHWRTVRFENDPRPVGRWATNAVKKLQQWVKAIDMPNRDTHPFVATPRIECTMHCHHPALPVAMFTAMWDDGHTQTVNETMICFESKYAMPNVKWRQFPSIPLERQTLPTKIKVQDVNYGQVGIENIGVMWKGKFHPYRLIKTAGKEVKKDKSIVWLGPICQSLDSPLQRTEYDEALYEKV